MSNGQQGSGHGWNGQGLNGQQEGGWNGQGSNGQQKGQWFNDQQGSNGYNGQQNGQWYNGQQGSNGFNGQQGYYGQKTSEYNQSKSSYYQEPTGSQKKYGVNTRSHHQTSMQTNRQAQVLDQNYANNIIFMAMSNLEALQQYYSKEKGAKQFGGYDKYDYSYKELNELKAQLKMNMFLMVSSRQTFNQQHGSDQFTLPPGYNEERLLERLSRFAKFFEIVPDEQCYYMTLDFAEIIKDGKLTGLRYEKMTITDPYSGKGKASLVKNAMQSTEFMHQQREQIESLGPNITSKDLQFKTNPNYPQSRNFQQTKSKSRH